MNEFKYVYWNCDCWIFVKIPLNLCAYYDDCDDRSAAAAAAGEEYPFLSYFFFHKFFGCTVRCVPHTIRMAHSSRHQICKRENHKVESLKPKQRMREPSTPTMNSHMAYFPLYFLSPFVSVADACVFVHLRCMLHAIFLWFFFSILAGFVASFFLESFDCPLWKHCAESVLASLFHNWSMLIQVLKVILSTFRVVCLFSISFCFSLRVLKKLDTNLTI